MAPVKQDSTTIEIAPIATRTIAVAVKGTTPMILNRLAEKARQELLMPKGRKTTADKAAGLKHNPIEEFRSAPYILPDDNAPTLLAHMGSAFKGAAMNAALDLPGAKKAQIGRLVYVEGHYIPIFGIPELFMSVTRSADINKTPDVRTRVIIPRWAAMLTVTFATPMLNDTSILNLIAASGQISGIGDWRPEKGKGNFGQFVLTNPDTDEEFRHIVEAGGRQAQQDAMDNPVPYDPETEELFGWFNDEAKRRGKL